MNRDIRISIPLIWIRGMNMLQIAAVLYFCRKIAFREEIVNVVSRISLLIVMY
jgi:hypothetical protein